MAVQTKQVFFHGLAILIVCFFDAAFSKPKSHSSWFERPQSDASTANFFKLFNTKFRLLERKIDVDFRILGQTLREELRGIGSLGGGCRPNGGSDDTSQTLSRLKFEVQTLQMDIKQMASDQKRFEDRIMLVLNNGTEQLSDRLNGVEDILQNVSDSVEDVRKSVDLLFNKIETMQPSEGTTATPSTTTPTPRDSEGDIRLVGGSHPYEGRVEIYHSGEWGTVCDDGWGNQDARVVCRQLGYSGGLSSGGSSYGNGQGPTWMDEVACNGVELRLDQCRFPGWRVEDCSHSEDAGVVCDSPPLTTLPPSAAEGDIRLVNTYNDVITQGRLEIFHDGEWGTVCGDGFIGSNVVCRQLGFTGGHAVEHTYGEGTGRIWMDNVNCHGTGAAVLSECSFNGWGVHDCTHRDDIGIVCDPARPTPVPTSRPRDQNVRLVGGRNSREGRVEVYYRGEWGTICDDYWGDIDATVVCRSLGYRSGTAQREAHFGQGSGPIWLDNVDCNGNERSVGDCGHRGWGVEDCGHSEDAGATCSGDEPVTTPPTPVPSTAIRLVRGSVRTEGRVEVYHNGRWGTVCDDSWDDVDAGVVCRMLGYGNAGTAVGNARFGEGSEPTWMDSVACTGSEISLFDCSFSGWGVEDCSHSEDAGVICRNGTITTPRPAGRTRLVNGLTQYEGRVEVFYDGRWGTVCDDGWDNNDARVVCRSLGYSGGTYTREASFGQGSEPTWLDQVSCSGSEQSLFDCSHDGWGIEDCSHSEDAGVRCDGPSTSTVRPGPQGNLTEGSIRLVGGDGRLSGRVEIYHNFEWGTICDDGWEKKEATVVCRQLGFGGGKALSGAHYGTGSGSIWMDDVNCKGNEMRLSDCPFPGWGTNNCGHGEDASVECEEKPEVMFEGIRLVNGSHPLEGRVEIRRNGTWGTICDDDFDDKAAKVACRMLGSIDGISYGEGRFGQGVGPIWLDDVRCTGNEETLFDCRFRGFDDHNCGHDEDVGVTCMVPAHNVTDGPIATVFPDVTAEPEGEYNYTYPANETGNYTEPEPEPTPEMTTSSTPKNVTISPVEGHVRLVEGISEYHGRVEIYHNGEWGTVCDDNFDEVDARVVCRQLGYGYINARVDSDVRPGVLKTWMDEVRCIGTEESLANCEFAGWNNEDCSKSEDVGVHCDAPDATIPPLFEGKIRLVGGDAEYKGRVEIYHNDEWGTVCDDSFGENDARVVCRQLGYSGGEVSTRVPAGSGRTWMDEVRCDGTEEFLKDCRFNGWGNEDCSHDEDVGVLCNDPDAPPPPQSGDIRLVGGNTPYEGRIEIYYRGQWGTVCDDSWTTPDAEVVCRQLNYGGGIAKSSAFYGPGVDPIWMDEVKCIGTEARLSECDFRGWGYEDCGHSEDAGVQCSPPVMTTTPQTVTTTEMTGCFNETQFECFSDKNCIDVEEMCNGEQNCADGSDEMVCNNEDHIIAHLGDKVSFVCAAPYPTVNKMVSWFYKNVSARSTELIAMGDFIFSSSGNFSAVRYNQRVSVLILNGVAERNIGIYECHVDNVDVIAKHELSLQQDVNISNCDVVIRCALLLPNNVDDIATMCEASRRYLHCMENVTADCLTDALQNNLDTMRSTCRIIDPEPEPEPDGGDNVDCLTESTNCFSVLSSLDPVSSIDAMCSTSRRFMACVDNLPQRCLDGQEVLLQNLEQQRNTMEALCNNVDGGEEISTPPVDSDGSIDCYGSVATCVSIMNAVSGSGDITTVCSAIPSFLACFDNIPQQCLYNRDDLLQSIQEQRNILRNACPINIGSGSGGGGDEVYVNSTVEMGPEDDCVVRAQTCMGKKLQNMTDIIAPSSDPSVRSRLCGAYSTCFENAECQIQDASHVQGTRLMREYCSGNVTEGGCQPSAILDCYLPMLSIANNQDSLRNVTVLCSFFQKFESCVLQLPENCQIDGEVSHALTSGRTFCGGLTENATSDPSICRFREYSGYKVISYPRYSVSGSSVNDVEECKRVCDDRCHGFEFNPFSSGRGGSCSLYEVGSVAAIKQDSNRPYIYYEKDCFEAENGPCDRLQNTRCPTGQCIPYSAVCDANSDCSDGSDEQDCATEAAILENETDGIVMLKMQGKINFICDEAGSFSDSSVDVLCKSLGYRYGNKFTSSHSMVYPQSWITNVACKGDEKDIFDCPYRYSQTCSVQKAVAVSCSY